MENSKSADGDASEPVDNSPAPGSPDAPLRAKAWAVYEALLERYGERPRVPRREPLHELVSTMLSHRTTARQEGEAFARMWARYGSWDAVRDADPDELAAELAPARWPEAKAANVRRALALIAERRGDWSLDFLAEWPADEGLAWLLDLPGVGVKTATLVLLFCFGKPLLPVDTHLHRVSGRLGLIGPKTSAEKAHRELLALLPADDHVLFNFHVSMLRHGQKLCVWRDPRCGDCPLRARCDWYRERRADTPAK